MLKTLLIIVFTLLLTPIFAVKIVRVTCEFQESPLALQQITPRFGWEMSSKKNNSMQSAYEIQVTGQNKSNLIWKSGRINSSESQLIRYNGEALKAGQAYRWRVRVWDEQGKPSQWSKYTNFRMAPVTETINAKWIGAIRTEDARIPAGKRFLSSEMRTPETRAIWNAVDSLSRKSILLRKSFQNQGKSIEEAVTHISGLGHYELTINGQKVGNSEFAPLWTDYDKTVYFNTYDISSLIKRGENVFGVMLGNGFYNVQGGRYFKLRVSFGAPTLWMVTEIRYTDGSKQIISTDESWLWHLSPITFNDIYGGEDYDARLETPGWDMPGFVAKNWKPVVIQTAPKGILTPQQANPVKIMRRYSQQSVKKLTVSEVDSTIIRTRREVDPSAMVFDMAQNLSGFPEITVSGKAGDRITLVVGEALTPEGAPDQRQTGRQHLYHYTLKGGSDETWHPRFSYYGFRYIQVEGAVLKGDANPRNLPVIKNINACFVHNSARFISEFESSNMIFNQAHVLIRKAVKSNMHAVFTDCPHREKLGWLEQVHLNGPGLMYNFDLSLLMPKVMQDMADAQLPNGMIPTIAPMYNIFGNKDGFDDFGDSPEWGSTFIILPWMYYDFYGDPSLIVNYYDAMKQYVQYLGTKSSGHILSHGLGDWYDYGNFKAGFSRNTPVPLVATAYYFYDLTLLARAARMKGNKQDEIHFSQLAEEVRQAFNQRFFNQDKAYYGTGSQASNAIPLYLNMVDEAHRGKVLQQLLNDIEKRGTRLSTGDVGNRYLFQTLADNGHNEVMYRMHNHEEAPGYGFQLKFGATTLTEQWDPRMGSSWNHFMMGQIDEWFFASLAGIRPGKPGFKEIIIQPEVVGDLSYVRGSHRSAYGKIAVNWKKSNQKFVLNVEIPVNCSAKIYLPGETTPKEVLSGRHRFEKILEQ
jgi:hypothetical protein